MPNLSLRAIGAVALASMSIALQGCEPCFGVANCRGQGGAAVEGEVLTTESGTPVPNVALTLIGYYDGAVDSASTTSDAHGLFSIALTRPGFAPRLALRVHSPGTPGYVIDSLPCRRNYRPGDACTLNPLIELPDLPVLRLFNRTTVLPESSIVVSFRRTGGPHLFGERASDSAHTASSADGYLAFFVPGVFADGLDSLIGDLIVEFPPPIGRTVRPHFAIKPGYNFRAQSPVYFLAGPSLAYCVTLLDSATNQGIAGAEATFQRTAGIAVKADTARHLSKANGLACFRPVPQATGTAVGNVRIQTPRTATPTDIGSVSLATFDADSTIVFGRWRVGVTGTLYPLPP